MSRDHIQFSKMKSKGWFRSPCCKQNFHAIAMFPLQSSVKVIGPKKSQLLTLKQNSKMVCTHLNRKKTYRCPLSTSCSGSALTWTRTVDLLCQCHPCCNKKKPTKLVFLSRIMANTLRILFLLPADKNQKHWKWYRVAPKIHICYEKFGIF